MKEIGDGSRKKTTMADWRKLFSAAKEQSLKFYPPQRANGKVIVSPPKEVFERGESKWKNVVVVQFVGRIPNFSLFQRMLKNLWGKEGEIEIVLAGFNLFVIQFPNTEMRDKVLESDPWHIQNKPLIVRKWES